MDIDFEKRYHQVAKTYWWLLKRRELIVEWLSRFPKDAVILDIGCSSGVLLTDLRKQGYRNLYGIDVSESAVALAREYGHEAVQVMDGSNIHFDTATFDVIIASDCLEHIEQDQAALDNWCRILKPGGTLIVFVPAHMYLWSAHDVENHHCRRYSSKQLVSLMESTGFTVKRTGFWNFFLFPGIALLRFYEWLFPKTDQRVSDLYAPPKLINSMLAGLIHIENRLLRYIDLPIGISTFVVAEKPEG